MKYSTYLFDFDGTLVDSMPSFVSAMLRILDDNFNADKTTKICMYESMWCV